jgi:hypothetical protein
MLTRTDIDALKDDLEKLVLLEQIAERRQELIEKRIAEALDAGMAREQLRDELGLSAESLERLVKDDPPSVPERLDVSQETAENLTQLA